MPFFSSVFFQSKACTQVRRVRSSDAWIKRAQTCMKNDDVYSWPVRGSLHSYTHSNDDTSSLMDDGNMSKRTSLRVVSSHTTQSPSEPQYVELGRMTSGTALFNDACWMDFPTNHILLCVRTDTRTRCSSQSSSRKGIMLRE
jgi:hypothetical protein